MEVNDLDPDRIAKVAKDIASVVKAHLAAGPDSPFTVFEVLNAAAWVLSTIIRANQGPIDANAFFLSTLKEHVDEGPAETCEEDEDSRSPASWSRCT